MTLSLNKKKDKEELLNLYIRLSNEYDIMLGKYEYRSGMYNLNLCKVIEDMNLSHTDRSLLKSDLMDYRTQYIGVHWFKDSADRKRILSERIENLRKELSVYTYNSRVEKNKEVIRFNLNKNL